MADWRLCLIWSWNCKLGGWELGSIYIILVSMLQANNFIVYVLCFSEILILAYDLFCNPWTWSVEIDDHSVILNLQRRQMGQYFDLIHAFNYSRLYYMAFSYFYIYTCRIAVF